MPKMRSVVSPKGSMLYVWSTLGRSRTENSESITPSRLAPAAWIASRKQLHRLVAVEGVRVGTKVPVALAVLRRAPPAHGRQPSSVQGRPKGTRGGPRAA